MVSFSMRRRRLGSNEHAGTRVQNSTLNYPETSVRVMALTVGNSPFPAAVPNWFAIVASAGQLKLVAKPRIFRDLRVRIRSFATVCFWIIPWLFAVRRKDRINGSRDRFHVTTSGGVSKTSPKLGRTPEDS